MQHQWNIYPEKRACWCLWKALPNRQFLARKRHWWQCAKQKQIGPRSEGGRVIGRETPASSFPMAFGGRREIASRSSSIQESASSDWERSAAQGLGRMNFMRYQPPFYFDFSKMVQYSQFFTQHLYTFKAVRASFMFLMAYGYEMQSDNTDAMTILSSGQLHFFLFSWSLRGKQRHPVLWSHKEDSLAGQESLRLVTHIL